MCQLDNFIHHLNDQIDNIPAIINFPSNSILISPQLTIILDKKKLYDTKSPWTGKSISAE